MKIYWPISWPVPKDFEITSPVFTFMGRLVVVITSTFKGRKLREDVVLSTGAVVRHQHMKNGAQDARVIGRDHGAMSIDEHLEYCRILKERK